MKLVLSSVASLSAASLLAVAAIAGEPEEKSSRSSDAEETSEKAAKAEEKRICRRIKLEMGSRRTTKVCKTAEEWREFNNPR